MQLCVIFSLATSESWKDKNTGQKQEKTEWHRVVVWNKVAELCQQYLAKGRQVYLEGRLQTRSWDDKDGLKRYTTEIMANSVQFLGGQGQSAAPGAGNSSDQFNSAPPSFPEQNNTPSAGDSSSKPSGAPSDTHFTADDIPF